MYKEPFCKRHFVPVLSFSLLFRLTGYTLCVVLAIVAAFASGGMWMKRKLSTAQADVHFQYKALANFMVFLRHLRQSKLVDEGINICVMGCVQEAADLQSPRSCSTDDMTNHILGPRLGICSMFVTQEDYNNDGKIDHYRIQMGVVNVEGVTSMDLTLEFLYHISVRCLR